MKFLSLQILKKIHDQCPALNQISNWEDHADLDSKEWCVIIVKSPKVKKINFFMFLTPITKKRLQSDSDIKFWWLSIIYLHNTEYFR